MRGRHRRRDVRAEAFWMQVSMTVGGLVGLLLFAMTHMP